MSDGTGDGGGTVIRAEEPGQMTRAGPWRRRRLKLAGVQFPTTATHALYLALLECNTAAPGRLEPKSMSRSL